MRNEPKLFISYAHVDADYHNDFRKHLKVMEGNKEIEVWSDVELRLGDEITPEIIRKLLESDVVVFLASPDFFDSNFITNVEIERSLGKDANKKIIPIILRHCDWQNSKIGKYLAPEDGKPISEFENKDEVWTKVINKLRRAIVGIEEQKEKEKNKYVIQQEFLDFLNDSEVVFYHKNKEKINLEDIYVFPDLRAVAIDGDTEEKIDEKIDAEKIEEIVKKQNKILILGDEQAGKTSLSKMLFRSFFRSDYLPVLLSGQKINDTQADKYLERAISAQYVDLNLSKLIQSSRNKIVIIDNFQETSLNKTHQRRFLENLEKNIGLVIILGDSLLQYYEPEYLVFSRFIQFKIQLFGHLKRDELIRKWNSIGEVETIDEIELEKQTDKLTRNIDQIIKGNIVPSKPIYVLTIIQTLEVTKRGEHSLTSYGYCYESLILLALKKQKIHHEEFETYFNYLKEVAIEIFRTKKYSLSEDELKLFEKRYSDEYIVDSHHKTQEILIKSKILRNDNGKTYFSYKYLYYFYVAKYIADELKEGNCQDLLENLCENLHLERNANILIFLVHHSKEKKIIEQILFNTMGIFEKTPEETLALQELLFLTNVYGMIPKLMLQQKSVEAERRNRLIRKDELEKNEKPDTDSEEGELFENNEIFKNIVKSAKSIEVIGQILRNYHGSLKKSDLKNLSSEAVRVGLRFLRFYLKSFESSQDQILEILQKAIKENSNESYTDDEASAKEAKKMYFAICHQMSLGVVWKISTSIGEEKLISLYEEVKKENGDSMAVRLIEVIMRLEFAHKMPKKEIEALREETLSSNPFVFRILQQVLIQHLYLHHVKHADKQWLSSILKVPVKSQLIIESKKTQI